MEYSALVTSPVKTDTSHPGVSICWKLGNISLSYSLNMLRFFLCVYI